MLSFASKLATTTDVKPLPKFIWPETPLQSRRLLWAMEENESAQIFGCSHFVLNSYVISLNFYVLLDGWNSCHLSMALALVKPLLNAIV